QCPGFLSVGTEPLRRREVESVVVRANDQLKEGPEGNGRIHATGVENADLVLVDPLSEGLDRFSDELAVVASAALLQSQLILRQLGAGGMLNRWLGLGHLLLLVA